MPDMAVKDDLTTLQRIEDGSLRITFCDTQHNKGYRDDAQLLIGNMIRSYFTVTEYSPFEFEVCMGEAITGYTQKKAEWKQPQPGATGVPFILPRIGMYPAYHCGLKAKRDGQVVCELHEMVSEYFESGSLQAPSRAPNGPMKKPPVVFDAKPMQVFINACLKEQGLGSVGLTDAVLHRVYGSVHGNLKDGEVRAHVAALIERRFFVRRPGSAMKIYDFGSASQSFLPALDDVGSEETVQEPNLQSPTEALAGALKKIQGLKARVALMNSRAESAEARAAEAAARVAELEAQQAEQSDTDAQVQAAVAAELARLIDEA